MGRAKNTPPYKMEQWLPVAPKPQTQDEMLAAFIAAVGGKIE